jgi:hypothetical protein
MMKDVFIVNIRIKARVAFTFFSNANLVLGQGAAKCLTPDDTDDENDEMRMMNDKDQRPANDVKIQLKENHSRYFAWIRR